jgi:hypothetical protein
MVNWLDSNCDCEIAILKVNIRLETEEDRYGGVGCFSLFYCYTVQTRLSFEEKLRPYILQNICLQNYKIVNTVETLCLYYRDSCLIRWRLHAQATKFRQAEV